MTKTSGTVTIKSTSFTGTDTIYTTGTITYTSALDITIQVRSSNLDSEIIYTADSITFYPTLTDVMAGTNP